MDAERIAAHEPPPRFSVRYGLAISCAQMTLSASHQRRAVKLFRSV
jgi:hypothetical protein